MAEALVRCEGVTRVYRVGAQQVAALRGVNLAIPAGSLLAVTGRSGSGKTTLLNLIGGLDRPTGGEITLAGQPLGTLSESELTELRRRDIGFIFQAFALLSTLSTFDNVALPLRIVGTAGRERDARVRRCLELVGLAEWASHRPYELSGGQQQRVAIARALVHAPRLILADEPTGDLDSETARRIFALFRRLVDDEGVTIVVASHDPLIEEYVDLIAPLRDGSIKN